MKKTKNINNEENEVVSEHEETYDSNTIDEETALLLCNLKKNDQKSIDISPHGSNLFAERITDDPFYANAECDSSSEHQKLELNEKGDSIRDEMLKDKKQKVNRIKIIDMSNMFDSNEQKQKNIILSKDQNYQDNDSSHNNDVGVQTSNPVSSLRNENRKFNFMSDSHDHKRSEVKEGFNAKTDYKNKDLHKQEEKMDMHKMNIKDSKILERERQTEVFFDVICLECDKLGIQCDKKQTNALYHLLRISNYEAEELGIESTEELSFQELNNYKKNIQTKKKRGRPPIISPELASSEFDEYGVKVDYEGGGIDFDDSLFHTIVEDDKEIYICKICSKPFPSKSRAKRHYITHTDYKPFKCGNVNCNKTFSRRDNMLQHERMHCSAIRKKDTEEK